MEEMTDRGLIADNCPRHGVHRRLPKTRTAEMISATAVREFPATAGTKGRLQIMNQRMTISADYLPLPDKSNLTERTAGGKNQLDTPPPPSSPRNHGKTSSNETREHMKKRNLSTPS
jgi:hypothetical protein